MFAQKLLLPALALLGSATAASVCTVSTTTITTQADATGLASCSTVKGSILIDPSASGTIDLSGPGQVTGNLTVLNSPGLISLTSSTITSIGETLTLQNLTFLSTFQFTELTAVTTILWSALPVLSSLTLPSFISKCTSCTITNTFLTTMNGLNFMSIGTLDINNNNRLTSFSTQIANITNSLNIAANGKLLDVEFPNLIWANAATFRDILTLSVPSLATVNASLTIDESFITGFSAPNLTTVGNFATKEGSLAFVGNTALPNLTMPVLTSVGGGIQVSNNTGLDTISFPVLTQVGGALDLSGNFSTPSLPKLNNVQGALNIQSTATIDCAEFTKLDGNVVQGKDTCVSATDDPTTANGTSTSSGSGSSSTSKGAATSSYSLQAGTIGLSVLGGLFGLLL